MEGKMNFSVVIHSDDNSFGATVPDLPGCFSAGETLDEVLEDIQEAILCHIEGLLSDDAAEGAPLAAKIPFPLPIKVHQKNKDFRDGIWAIVNVDLSQLSGKAKRVNITMPERILSQVDSFANQIGESRSGLLVAAVMNYITRK